MELLKWRMETSRKRRFENFDKGIYTSENEYGIPELLPIKEFDEKTHFISFNKLKTTTHKKDDVKG